MFTTHQSRRLVFGSAVVFALTLLAPVAVAAEDDITAMAPVAAPSADETGADAVLATRALAAQQALLSGDIGSIQEESLLAIVAAAPSGDATRSGGSTEASHAANALPVVPSASMTVEQTRVLAAQQVLLSPDLGSL
jgi:hypothetical protein